MSESKIPMEPKWVPFKRCDECLKRKVLMFSYYVFDISVIDDIKKYHICGKCMEEMRLRAKSE